MRGKSFEEQQRILSPKEEIAKRGFKGGSDSLPYKGEMEEKFGVDLSGVKVHSGGKIFGAETMSESIFSHIPYAEVRQKKVRFQLNVAAKVVGYLGNLIVDAIAEGMDEGSKLKATIAKKLDDEKSRADT